MAQRETRRTAWRLCKTWRNRVTDTTHTGLRARIEALPVYELDQLEGVIDVVDRDAVLALLETPQETAGEPVAWCEMYKSGKIASVRLLTDEWRKVPLYTHPTPAAAPTDNTALVEAAEHFFEVYDPEDADPHLVGEAIEEMRAALASRPAEATSRERVEVLEAAIRTAHSLIDKAMGDTDPADPDDPLLNAAQVLFAALTPKASDEGIK